MVQTEEQYGFLYDVFVEAATVHGTEVTAHGLYNHVIQLRQPVSSGTSQNCKPIGNGYPDGTYNSAQLGSMISGLELEFQVSRSNRKNINNSSPVFPVA